MEGAGFCSLYQEIHYNEIHYNEIWVYLMTDNELLSAISDQWNITVIIRCTFWSNFNLAKSTNGIYLWVPDPLIIRY